LHEADGSMQRRDNRDRRGSHRRHENLASFKPHGDGTEDNLGGTWTQDGKEKAVADKVVVINGNDNIYLLELNADCLPDQVDKALPATATIDEKTTINVG
jgi:hypothetical protein